MTRISASASRLRFHSIPVLHWLVSRKALNRRHLETSQCRTGREQKRQRLAEEEMRVTSEKAFHTYGIQMRAVTEFKYLGVGAH